MKKMKHKASQFHEFRAMIKDILRLLRMMKESNKDNKGTHS